MKIEFDTIDELKELISFLGSLSGLSANVQDEEHQSANAERQKRYRENKKRNENVTRNVTDVTNVTENVTETVTRNVTNVTLSQEERENEKEEERKESTKEKKEEERVKEKEELNILCASPKKPMKHRYGNFQHVMLSDDDMSRLSADFPDIHERIQKLDDYLENNPSKHYANHSLTIRNWAKRDAVQIMPKQIPKEQDFRDLRIRMEQDAAKEDNFIDSFWRS